MEAIVGVVAVTVVAAEVEVVDTVAVALAAAVPAGGAVEAAVLTGALAEADTR